MRRNSTFLKFRPANSNKWTKDTTGMAKGTSDYRMYGSDASTHLYAARI
jgi:hypothetical protein